MSPSTPTTPPLSPPKDPYKQQLLLIQSLNLRKLRKNVLELVSVKYAIEETNNDIEELRQKIAQTLQANDKIRRKQHLKAILTSRIKNMRKQLHKQKKELETDRKLLGQRKKKLMPFAERLYDAEHKLSGKHLLLQSKTENLSSRRSYLRKVEKKYTRRRLQILRNLSLIYPIEISPKGGRLLIANRGVYKKWVFDIDMITKYLLLCSIAFFSCRNSLAYDDEAYTALGYVAQVVSIISKLYKVELRYSVFPMASRSFVRSLNTPMGNSTPQSYSHQQQQL